MSTSVPTPLPQLPIIDFAGFFSGSQDERVIVAQQLIKACHEMGFAYIRNHGMAEERVKEAFGWAKCFFALDREDKLKAPHPLGFEVHRGYSDIGREKLSKPDRPPEIRVSSKLFHYAFYRLLIPLLGSIRRREYRKP